MNMSVKSIHLMSCVTGNDIYGIAIVVNNSKN